VCLSLSLSLLLSFLSSFLPFFRVSCVYRSIHVKVTAFTGAFPENYNL
jgi:hypothetical protein